MTEFKIGNLVRLRQEILEGWSDELRDCLGIGLIVEIVPPITGILLTYYRILFGEEKYIFRADEIELI